MIIISINIYKQLSPVVIVHSG